MPLPTAGAKNESGIRSGAMQPGAGEPGLCASPRAGLGTWGQPARKRVTLLGDGGGFSGLSLGLARLRRCGGEEEGAGGG